MASPTSNPFYVVIQTLQSNNIPLEIFIRRALLEPGIADSPYVHQFLEDIPRLLTWLSHYQQSQNIIKGWMKQEYFRALTSQIREISKPDKGFHLNASSITAEKMKECTIDKIADGIQSHAPDVWELVGSLMESDPAMVDHHKKKHGNKEVEETAESEEMSRRNNHQDIPPLIDKNDDLPDDLQEQLEYQRLSLLHIVRLFCF
jgi:hypothetical protein